MNEPLPDPLTIWRFIRRHSVRIVIGAVLLAAFYFAVSVYATYQREQRIAKKISSVGGKVEFGFFGPKWIPKSIEGRLPFFDRIREVRLQGKVDFKGKALPSKAVSLDVLSQLGSLTRLEDLYLTNTHIADPGLKHLQGLTHLKTLILSHNQVTDVGIEYLKGMRSLKVLFLNRTQITDSGLEHVKGLTSLESLCLNWNIVTDAGLGHLNGLTSLRYLGLDGTHVTDAGLEHLNGLKSLDHLTLHQTQTTANGRTLLLKALPGCREWGLLPFDDDIRP